MNQAAESTAQIINGFMTLMDGDLKLLLQKENELLRQTLATEAENSGTVIFLSDEEGNILLSTEEGSQKFRLPAVPKENMSDYMQKAKNDAYFKSNLGGFFGEEYLNHVILMEKEYTYDASSSAKYQVVGAIFICSEMAETENMIGDLLKSFLPAAIIVIAATLWGFAAISMKIIRPVRQMSTAAHSFAKGDFSARIPVSGNDEIAVLSLAFNEMAQSLEQLERKRSGLITSISHDLRTPLTTIGGFVQNILEGVIPPEKEDYYLQIILDEVSRVSRLVSMILDLSKLDAGERKFVMIPFDICELARRILLSFEKKIEERKIQVSFSCDSDNIIVSADKDALHQVVYNLVDNAVKFTPQGGELRISVKLKKQKVFFSVYNSGDGVPPEELPFLFDRFYKSDRSRGLNKSGTGLGLYIAKTIINAHHEKIWVMSDSGKSCEFVFSLSLEPENATRKKDKNTE